MVPSSGHFGHLKAGMQTVGKETFQVPADLNSCIFSVSIILTSKPKRVFCGKSYLFSLMKNYSLLCERVSCSYDADGREIATILNEFHQSLQREKTFSLILRPQKNFPSGNLCLNVMLHGKIRDNDF